MMIGQKHRAQILLEPTQHQALIEIARQEQRSISDIVRQIIAQHLEERTASARRQRAVAALERLACLRERIKQRSGVYQGNLVAEVRGEREAYVEQVCGIGGRDEAGA